MTLARIGFLRSSRTKPSGFGGRPRKHSPGDGDEGAEHTMSQVNRRQFLGRIGSGALTIPAVGLGALRIAESSGLAAFQGVAASYDLVIAGGRMIDPSQNLSAERDVAIVGGRIAKVDVHIPRDQARRVFDATGKIVTPGLIDLHSHVYSYGTSYSVDPDVIGVQSGVTTVVDAGTTGSATFPAFRKFVVDAARTRVYALLNISTIGTLVVIDEIGFLDPKLIDVPGAVATILANRDRIVGVKVVLNGTHGELQRELPVVKAARAVADATGLPIMMHWSNEPELLALLRKGDILTHPFNPVMSPFGNLFGTRESQADRVLPQILALKERGIWTDGQLANTHHGWDISEKAMQLGWVPDVISTDLARMPDGRPASVLLPMSEYLQLGLPLERVIAGVTANPARALQFPKTIGTLKPGVAADVAVLELTKGRFEVTDRYGKTRVLTQMLAPVATVKDGVMLKGAAAPPVAGTAR
jgi:dihydroorotase